jgi:hypothetical protein
MAGIRRLGMEQERTLAELIVDRLDRNGFSVLGGEDDGPNAHDLINAAIGEWAMKALLPYQRTILAQMRPEAPRKPVAASEASGGTSIRKEA